MPPVPARLQSALAAPRSALRLLPSGEPHKARDDPSSAIQGVAEALALDADWSRTLAALGGEAARKRLHALHPARPGDEGAATGFALAVLGLWGRARSEKRALQRPILWVQDRSARAESGRPYSLGLAAFGINPAQLVFVSTKGALDALAAVEMGLEIGALDGVLVELPPGLPADMLALGKRLALRAERSTTPCLMLHASYRAVSAPVATRWEIASLPALADGASPQRIWNVPLPLAALALVKNRFGPTGRWSVPLGCLAAQQSLPSQGASDVSVARSPSPLPQSVDAHVGDRPRPTATPSIRAA
jgi:hypothetical protein